MERIIDSHAHLNDEALINDIDSILSRMKENGVYKVLVPGWDIKSSKDAIELTKYDEIYAAIGIHPENIEGLTLEDVKTIEELSLNNKVIAIGEIGLDYHWTKETEIDQKEFLIAQLELAHKLNFPVLIHMRDATEDFMIIIREFIKNHGIRDNIGIMHSYSGSVETMDELLKLGFYISFSGPVTYKNAIKQKECAKLCPLDRVLIETDSPYLSPVPFRGTKNEPKNVYYVLEEISKLKDISQEELAMHIRENFNKLFHLRED